MIAPHYNFIPRKIRENSGSVGARVKIIKSRFRFEYQEYLNKFVEPEPDNIQPSVIQLTAKGVFVLWVDSPPLGEQGDRHRISVHSPVHAVPADHQHLPHA